MDSEQSSTANSRTARASNSQRGLSLDSIVTETLTLIDDQGIAAASMRNVARRLGVKAMSLYRHASNREDLLDAVVDRIVNELNDDPDVPAKVVGNDWRPYLEGLAWGIRRYARGHPHAFPLVATRPPDAPWVNPPLRSVRWIEAMLRNLQDAGFTDEQVVFTYRTFNSFLLGFLLLETSAMVIADPKPGDGSFQSGSGGAGTDPVDPSDPVPGALSATRSAEQREQLANSDAPQNLLDPDGNVSADDYPMIHRLRAGLTEDRYEEEFELGLKGLLTRIADHLDST